MFPSTVARVREHTPDWANERIRRRTRESVARCAAGGPEAIDRRLEELDREWDIERTLETNAATVALFLLQHAVQGWCPPLPVFRRLGVRTTSEIDEERYALKALRGDFRNVGAGDGHDPESIARAIKAARN